MSPISVLSFVTYCTVLCDSVSISHVRTLQYRYLGNGGAHGVIMLALYPRRLSLLMYILWFLSVHHPLSYQIPCSKMPNGPSNG